MQLLPIPLSGAPQLPSPADAYTQQMIEANQAFYGRVGHAPPWVCFLAVRDGAVVGTCGFKGAPVSGAVEIAYHTFPAHEGQGVATAMAEGMVRIAQAEDANVLVTAQTRPANNASVRILEKLGFTRTADGHDEEVGVVWCWERRR